MILESGRSLCSRESIGESIVIRLLDVEKRMRVICSVKDRRERENEMKKSERIGDLEWMSWLEEEEEEEEDKRNEKDIKTQGE